MQLVSYSTHTLADAQLAKSLAYCFISPEKFPVPPFLSSIYRYRTLYPESVGHILVHAPARICTTHIVLYSTPL